MLAHKGFCEWVERPALGLARLDVGFWEGGGSWHLRKRHDEVVDVSVFTSFDDALV
jgi:hypothetical protein